MGVDFEDYNNDGRLDIVVTNFSDDWNTLYRIPAKDSSRTLLFSSGIAEAPILT